MNPVSAALHDPGATIAVVGANDDPGKYGSVIYRDLKGKGFVVYPVNPRRDTVDGDPAYATLADLPAAPTIVNFVVPPQVSLAVLAEAKTLGYNVVWLQPGSSSTAVREYVESHGFDYTIDACIMVHARPRKP